MSQEDLSDIEQVPTFLQLEDWEDRIGNLSKAQLILIAEHEAIEVPEGIKKGALLLKIVTTIKEGQSVLDASNIQDEAMLLEKQIKCQELRMQELKLQMQYQEKEAEEREKEREEKEKEREEKEREREYELLREREKAEREREREAHELKVLSLKQLPKDCDFNVSTALKLVPAFNELNVAEFFVAFEKIANKLSWPKEMWTTLLQCRLVGKAQKVYITLNEDLSSDYDSVKAIVLKAYKLVPEAYRQKFRDLKKLPNQTYVEFARLKEQTFEEWVKAKEVDDFTKLKELILVEEFKSCLHRDLKVHLEELKLDSLQEVAIASDEYVLSHRSYGVSSNRNVRYDKWKTGPSQSKSPTKSSSSSSASSQIGKVGGKGGRSPPRVRGSPPRGASKDVLCFFCRQKGHFRSQCSQYKKFCEEQKKPVGLLVSSPVERGTQVPKGFEKHISLGKVSNNASREHAREVSILRDTGALHSLILRSALPDGFAETNTQYVLLGGFPDTVSSWPLEKVFLESKWGRGYVELAVVDKLPVRGVDVVVANDLVDGEEVSSPVIWRVAGQEASAEFLEDRAESPISVVTRSKGQPVDLGEVNLDLQVAEDTTSTNIVLSNLDEQIGWNRESLRKAQETEFREKEELAEEPTNLTKPVTKWYQGLLYRFSRSAKVPADVREVQKQIVVPERYREKLMGLSHDNHLAGHFGFQKTSKKLSEHFFWPGMKKDVKRYVNTCITCQLVGKPNQKIPKAPLRPIPSVGEPFQEVIIDIVGPLPRTKSGNEYLLTIMDRMSKYPEAIPIRSIRSVRIVEELVGFFTKFGLPKILQSDCGSNFVSKYFQDKMKELGVKHITSSPYHPESQGQLERFHQTLKSMIKKYCLDHDSEWDKEIPYLLFAFRSAPGESVKCSPFQLIFGHAVRGPLEVVREHWEGETPELDVISYVNGLGEKLTRAWEFAKKNLRKSQEVMKANFDPKTKVRVFQEGDKVLVLLPTPGNPLKAAFSGPWKIIKKVSELNYLVETPGRRKKHQLCHVNMLKAFRDRAGKEVKAATTMVMSEIPKVEETIRVCSEFPDSNSDILSNLTKFLDYLPEKEQESLIDLIVEFKDLFKDTPGRTTLLEHDVEIENSPPVKQCPYRLNPVKNSIVDAEVKYMMDNDLIEASNSPWSSPVVLVKKEDGKSRLCFDYRKLNSITKTDSYPLPRVEDCIDQVGNAKYITKVDLLKGYWQVGLTPRARAVSAFVTHKGLFECKVMPFGMKNAAATFQRLMNLVTQDLEGCVVYIDDVIIYSDDWQTHLDRIRRLFEALRRAGLVINLKKSDFARAKVVYLGHEVGHGKIAPKNVNIQAILNFPIPYDKRTTRRFLGMAGYYRRFVRNFSEIAHPLTNLLKKEVKFMWKQECQRSFDKLKAILVNFPVLRSPDFKESFELAIDASDVGVGAVLSQKDPEGIVHPVAYFSKKLTGPQTRYSTIEKETLGLILALEHFEVYLSTSCTPIKVFTDHNPLKFISRFKNKNQRLVRWSIFLQEWNLEICHIPGSENRVPDALSRV